MDGWTLVNGIVNVISRIPIEKMLLRRPDATEELIKRLEKAEKETPKTVIVASAEVTQQDTVEYQRKQLAKKLLLVELHLGQGCRIAGKICDCCTKHASELEALAEESISIDPASAKLYNDVVGFIQELRQKASKEALTKGSHANEYPALAATARNLRKQLMP